MNNPFVNAQKQLLSAAKLINLDAATLERLMNPDRVLKFSIPVKMDNGKVRVFQGFRSQHNNARGPYKGGIRFHQSVNEDEVMALSTWMTWKCATTGIPYGGGKGGVIVNPAEVSERELEQISRGYVRQVANFIGPDIDIPAPDVNTNPKVMAWMSDEYNQIKGGKYPGTFTGKPIENGGSKGRDKATAQGGIYVLEALAKEVGMKANQTTVAIQGFGNAGQWFAKLASELGFKVVALSDSKGGVVNMDGLDIAKASEHKAKTRALKGFKGAKAEITNEDLLQLEVDVLVPAALENVITSDNAKNISAKYVIELANGPTTPEADEILHKKGIMVVPDILANAGGVTVSYFEWVQNRMGYYWTEEEVLAKLKPLMVSSFEAAYKAGKELEVDMRMGTYALAVKRVAKAMI